MAVDIQIRADAKEAAEQLHKVREAGLLAREGVHALSEASEALGVEVGKAFQTVMLAREGFLALRSAALLAGTSLAAVAPYVGAITIAIGAGIAVWDEWKKGMAEVGEQAQKLDSHVKGLGETLSQLQTLRKGGAFSEKDMQFYTAFILGARGAKDAPNPADRVALENILAHRGEMEAMGLSKDAYTPEEINPYALKRLLVENHELVPTKDGGFDFTEARKAANQMRELREQLLGTGDNDLDTKLAELAKKYGDLTDQVKIWGREAVKSGKATQHEMESLLKLLDETESREVRNAEIDWRSKSQKPGELPDPGFIPENLRKIAEQESADMERKLTKEALEAGLERGQDYEHEYLARKRLLESQRFEGVINERDYTVAVQENENKRLEAARRAAQEELQLSRLSRENDVARLHMAEELVRQNPYLSEKEKAEELIPILRKITEELDKQLADVEEQLKNPALDPRQRGALLQQQTQLHGQSELTNQSANTLANQGTAIDTLKRQAKEFKDAWDNVASSLVSGAFKQLTDGIHGMADAFTKAIMGAESLQKAMVQFAESALSSFIEMVLETVMYALIAIPVLTALGVLSAGATATQGAAIVPVALATTLSSTMGMVGRESGGPVEAGMPYLVGEAGKELFVPTTDGVIIPNSLINGSSSSSSSSSQPAGRPVSIHFHPDRNTALKEAQSNPDWDAHIMQVVRRNMHKISIHP